MAVITDKYGDQWPLQVFYEINGLIRTDVNLEYKFKKAVEMIKESLKCDSVSLFIFNKEKQILEEAATVGSRVDLLESTQLDNRPGLSAWMSKKRDSVFIPNIQNSNTISFKSIISTPLHSGDNLVGTLNVGHLKPDYFNEKHKQFIDIIAGELTGTIERFRLGIEIDKKNSSLTLANNEIVKLQKQIAEMEKYQTLIQFAASINHEINNPLTSIIGNIELMLMKYTDMDEQIEKKLRVVLNESRRIENILKNLRDIKENTVQDYIENIAGKKKSTGRLSEKNREENLS